MTKEEIIKLIEDNIEYKYQQINDDPTYDDISATWFENFITKDISDMANILLFLLDLDEEVKNVSWPSNIKVMSRTEND